ncbi:hypothetical protein Bhyg_02802 [Pseudolycoriella hygida]|uniref:Uncharacterized protein n=1 Tax=Pseudolycoriella hygida TaxID=35572 RepID=A0A9Q0NC77_9DIPT|nr:hypothetical protein Bhyg_02802 [Pseudolycoriella hygida]
MLLFQNSYKFPRRTGDALMSDVASDEDCRNVDLSSPPVQLFASCFLWISVHTSFRQSILSYGSGSVIAEFVAAADQSGEAKM